MVPWALCDGQAGPSERAARTAHCTCRTRRRRPSRRAGPARALRLLRGAGRKAHPLCCQGRGAPDVKEVGPFEADHHTRAAPDVREPPAPTGSLSQGGARVARPGDDRHDHAVRAPRPQREAGRGAVAGCSGCLARAPKGPEDRGRGSHRRLSWRRRTPDDAGGWLSGKRDLDTPRQFAAVATAHTNCSERFSPSEFPSLNSGREWTAVRPQ